MENNVTFKITITIFVSLICIFLILGGTITNINNKEKEFNRKEQIYKQSIQEKDSLINYYDSLSASYNLEKERVLESVNKLINEKDRKIQQDLSKYYTSHDSVSWNELDSLLSVLLEK